jgi:hypothetical protein
MHIFFCHTEFSTVSSEFWCCFLYAHLIFVYFELKPHYHSIILNYVIQSCSVLDYKLVSKISQEK